MLLNLLLQITTDGAEAAAAAEEVVPTMETLSVFELIANGGWYIMLPLGVLSVIAVYIFIERFLAIPVGKSTFAPYGETKVESMMKNMSKRKTMSVMLDMLKLTSTLFLD